MRFIEDKPNLLRFLRVLDPEEISPRWDNVRLAEYPGVAAGPLDRRWGNLKADRTALAVCSSDFIALSEPCGFLLRSGSQG